MKNKIQIGLIIIILAICSHLIICNIEHIIYLNTTTYGYAFVNNQETKNIKASLDNIKSNIQKMDKLKNSYLSTNDIKNIKKGIETYVKTIEKLDFWKYDKSNNTMNQVEVYKFLDSITSIGVLSQIDQYRTMSNYNKNLNITAFVDYSLHLMLSCNEISNTLLENYKYESNNGFEELSRVYVLTIINNLSMRVRTIEYISSLVLESGDISE